MVTNPTSENQLGMSICRKGLVGLISKDQALLKAKVIFDEGLLFLHTCPASFGVSY